MACVRLVILLQHHMGMACLWSCEAVHMPTGWLGVNVPLMECREANAVQSEILREGKTSPLQELCAKGFADPGMAASWQISGCDSEADYVRLLMAKAVQNQAMEQIRMAAQELGRIQSSSGLHK